MKITFGKLDYLIATFVLISIISLGYLSNRVIFQIPLSLIGLFAIFMSMALSGFYGLRGYRKNINKFFNLITMMSAFIFGGIGILFVLFEVLVNLMKLE